MEPAIVEAISGYYKLKQKYDESNNKQKMKIIRDNSLSNKEKRQKFKQLKEKCVNCKNSGGTIFSNTDRILRAVCGSSTPCTLNIEIKKGRYMNVREVGEKYLNEINNLKIQIIETKLNLLFGYTEEAEVLKIFTLLRERLGNFTETFLWVREHYLDIVNDTENMKAINEAEVSLFVEKEGLKTLHKLFDDSQNNSYINEMVEKYVSIIDPLVIKIRNMKYKSVYIETNDTDHTEHLIEEPYTFEQLQMEWGTSIGWQVGVEDSDAIPEIISNIK
tara:strand:- start:244 stop:1068 length:825 start_codon:yes stop_codon:yes gene_type:complete